MRAYIRPLIIFLCTSIPSASWCHTVSLPHDTATEKATDSPPDIASMTSLLKDFAAGKDARIGIAVIINGRYTVSVNGHRDFPMLSVYKFPQAIAVADYCVRHGISSADTVAVGHEEILADTWSPMRDRYGIRDLRLPLSELLAYSLQQSDNNACDILFRLIGGPQAADSLMNTLGFDDIVMASTEEEMHGDTYLCYQNRSTPLAMARLFDRLYRQGMRSESAMLETIATMMIQCATGLNRLPAPMAGTNAMIGHKTGTGDRNSQGRIMASTTPATCFCPTAGMATASLCSLPTQPTTWPPPSSLSQKYPQSYSTSSTNATVYDKNREIPHRSGGAVSSRRIHHAERLRHRSRLPSATSGMVSAAVAHHNAI